MVAIPLGLGDWESMSEDIPRLRLRNMYVTDNPNSPDGLSRVSRPTLTEFATVGSGPIYGFWRQDGTLSGDWLVVSDSTLYRVTPSGVATAIDPLPGEGFCKFAGTADRVIIVRDGTAYSTDGTDVSVVVMPDDVPGYDPLAAPVSSVACINSTFILPVLGSQRFYWINPGETDPDPLNFASAERTPDPIEDVAINTDEIWFIGSSAPEVWQTTTDADDPFVRINGRVYNEGCASRYTVASSTFNNYPCLIWVTEARSVVLAQGSVQKISSESVEESLKTATNLRGYSFRHNRHDFYVLTADEFTLALDLDRKEWSRWDSYGRDNLLAHLGSMIGSASYGASSVNGKLYKLEEGVSDFGNPVVREISGVVHNPGKNIPVASVSVRANSGWSPSYDFEPVIELRWSDDQGSTWSDYVSMTLGDKGQYFDNCIFRSLGLLTRPSRNFELRFSEPARLRIDGAWMNEI